MTNSMSIPGVSPSSEEKPPFPLNQWYVAALSKEIKDKPVARTLLNENIVLFRDANGKACALEDRCCHRALPLSKGVVEDGGLRCGYHGLLFSGEGQCLQIPGQEKIPRRAKVRSFTVVEQDEFVWVWFADEAGTPANGLPPSYPPHSLPGYVFDGDVYHYNAPYQLIHDNLLDLSHLGYVHLKTIGGNAKIHMEAEMKVESEGDSVRVVRHMLDSEPPPTYQAAYPFQGRVDRWQEIEFKTTHLCIWTGAVDVHSDDINNPERGGFHMRGFHGITPETETTSHYFWTIATNPKENIEEIKAKVVEQTALTFQEDKEIIEAQYENMLKFGDKAMIDIHVDVAPNRARKIIESLR